MIRQIAVAVLSMGALAACVPYGDGMTPYSSGYANPLTQALAAAVQPTPYGYGQAAPYGYSQPAPYGYGQPAPYGYGQAAAPYGYGYQAAPAPMYAPPVYMPQQAAAPVYAPSGYGYGGGRAMAPGMRRAAADRDGNGVPDWRERDRNGDGTPDYQQRTRRTR
jgi:hypothetical protein